MAAKSKPAPTYAANTKLLAIALGLKPGRKQLAEVGQWIARPDFPPKEKLNGKLVGWRITEAQVWLRNFQKSPESRVQSPSLGNAKSKAEGGKGEHPTSNIQHPTSNELPPQPAPAGDGELFLSEQEQFRAMLDYWQDVYLNPTKHPLVTIPQWRVAELREHGRIPSLEAAPPPHGSPAAVAPRGDAQGSLGLLVEKVTTQKAILPELQRHYRGRLVNEITVQNISDWHRGLKLPDANAPCAPHKDGNYFYIGKWIEWFDRWILPYWQLQASDLNGSAGALFSPVEMERMRRDDERDALLHNKFIRDRERAGYLPVAAAQNQRRGQIKLGMGFVQRALEAAGVKELTEWLATQLNLSPEQRLAVQEKLARFMQETTDKVYDYWTELAAADPETELAKQLAEKSQ